jgi:tripartite-type tricarboxylate transporter receptor subunit TctC
MVLPYAPGSASDAYGRALGEHFLRVLGQPVVVVNRDGGSGVVGMRFTAQSTPDGHTIALTPMTAVVVQPHLVRNTGTAPENFAPICGTNENVLGVLVRSESPIRDLAGLIEGGRLRLIAVFSTRRHPDYPDVPTAREQGVDAEQLSHVGLYAPRGTPEPVLDQLEAACRSGTEDASFRRVAAASRVPVNFLPRAEFTAMVTREFESNRAILRTLGVEAE